MLESLDMNRYFPDWWLTFLILSKPDIINAGSRNCFCGGQHVAKGANLPLGKSGLANGDGSSGEPRVPHKSARTRFHTYASQSRQSSSASVSSGDGKKTGEEKKSEEGVERRRYIHEVVVSNPMKESMNDRKLKIIEQQIALRLKNGEDENSYIITTLRNRQISILEKQLIECDSEESSA